MRLDLDYLKSLEHKDYSQENRVYCAAMHYISAGIPVLPLRPNSKILPKRTRDGVNQVTYHQAAVTRKTVESWFNPDTGRFAGWNVGLGCGKKGGIFVVDVDRKGETDGMTTLDGLIASGEAEKIPSTPTQITPSGGYHYLFHWQENCVPSTGKIGKAIDTRGGTSESVKSHIVAFPSIVEGKMYKWKMGGEVADVPAWVMRRMGVPWVARAVGDGISRGTGRGNENVTADDEEVQIPLDQIRRMLETIDPDDLDYDDWLKMGMSIHSQHPGEDGLEVWDSWSQQGSRYKPRECHLRWSGFDGTGNVRIGTLYHWAKEYGWSPMPEDSHTSPIDLLVAQMNEQYGMVQVGGKVKIIRKKKGRGDSNPGQSNFDILDRDSFHALHANKKEVLVNPQTGKPAIKTWSEIWIAHQHRRTYEEGIGMFPNSGKPGYFNVWQGWGVDAEPGDVKPFIDHVRNIICNGDEKLTEWVLDWCAHVVQHPAKKIGTALVMRGPEGAGKGMFADTLGRLFGAHYIHMIDEHHLTTNFNHHMLNAILVYADEVVWGGNKKAASKLKGLVSEQYLMYEMKGIDTFSAENHVHLIMATNEEWAVPAGAHSRRWLVLDVSGAKSKDMQHWSDFLHWRDDGGLEYLLHYLLNREIKSPQELHLAPETEAVSEQRAMHMMADNVYAWWREILDHEANGWQNIDPVTGMIDVNESTPWARIVDRKQVYESYSTFCSERNVHYRDTRSPQMLYRRLEKWGVQMKDRRENRLRVSTGPGPKVYYCIIPMPNEAKKLFREATGISIEE